MQLSLIIFSFLIKRYKKKLREGEQTKKMLYNFSKYNSDRGKEEKVEIIKTDDKEKNKKNHVINIIHIFKGQLMR